MILLRKAAAIKLARVATISIVILERLGNDWMS